MWTWSSDPWASRWEEAISVIASRTIIDGRSENLARAQFAGCKPDTNLPPRDLATGSILVESTVLTPSAKGRYGRNRASFTSRYYHSLQADLCTKVQHR